MSGPARVALVGALWAGFGFISIASFEYAPNRYVVPALPGLALIVGSGFAVIAARTKQLGGRTQAAIVLVLVVLLAGPGLVLDAGWVERSGHLATDGQAAIERILPLGVRVAGGYAPLFAMRTPVITIVPIPGTSVNAGDLYASGVRWGFVEAGPAPHWVALHPEAWAARQEHWCTHWGRDDVRVCLIELP